jgi:hypothetical protein
MPNFKLNSVTVASESGGNISLGSTLGKTFASMQVFTSSGTWTKPAGVTAVYVTVTGGGGGAGAGEANYNSLSGGGAGGTAIKWITNPGASESVTVGPGGSGSPDNQSGTDSSGQTAGGTSSFGSHCSATGGYFGRNNASAQALGDSERGNGSGGDINLFGGDSDRYQGGDVSTDYSGGSMGGASYWGGGAMPGNTDGTTSGRPGRVYGAGGGSGDGTTGSTFKGGGPGKSGICVVWEYKG